MAPVHWETQGMFGPLAVVYNPFSTKVCFIYVVIYWQPVAEQANHRAIDTPLTKRCCNVPDLVDCGVIIPDFMGYTQRYAVFRRGFEPVDEVVEKVNEWKAALQDTTSAESENVPALHTTPRARSEDAPIQPVSTSLSTIASPHTPTSLPTPIEASSLTHGRVSHSAGQSLHLGEEPPPHHRRAPSAVAGPSSSPPRLSRARASTLGEPSAASTSGRPSCMENVEALAERLVLRKHPPQQHGESSSLAHEVSSIGYRGGRPSHGKEVEESAERRTRRKHLAPQPAKSSRQNKSQRRL